MYDLFIESEILTANFNNTKSTLLIYISFINDKKVTGLSPTADNMPEYRH